MNDLMQKKDFAEKHGISRAAVSQWIKRGKITLENGGLESIAGKVLVNAPAAERLLAELLRFDVQSKDFDAAGSNKPGLDAFLGNGGGDDDAMPQTARQDLQKAKIRKAQADADQAEMRVAQQRGEMVPMEQVLEQHFSIFRGFRDGLLKQIPAWADAFAGIDDPEKLGRVMKTHIEASLLELSSHVVAQ